VSWLPPDKIGGLTDAEAADFLARPWNGRLATVGPDGWPLIAPLWYEFEPGARLFWVVGRERATWVEHIRHQPRVAFQVADDEHAEHTRVQVQGQAEIVEGPVSPAASPRLLDLVRSLSLRYLGPAGPAYAERTLARPRVLVRITSDRWSTWTGREWHRRYR
jgi:PPOX class probable F420-dependent enzyme